MSLFGRQGLDTNSWFRSLRGSTPVIVAGLGGILLSWLILRILSPQTDHDATLTFYQLGGTSRTLEGGAKVLWYLASAGNVIWVPLVFYLYVFRRDRYDWTSAVVLAVAVTASMASSDILKALFQLPRPFSAAACASCPTEFLARVAEPTNFAFPSGHTTQAFTVAALVWRRYKQWRIGFLALGVATGAGMMVVGLHFLSDVIAGAFLGTISGTFATSLEKLRSESNPVTT